MTSLPTNFSYSGSWFLSCVLGFAGIAAAAAFCHCVGLRVLSLFNTTISLMMYAQIALVSGTLCIKTRTGPLISAQIRLQGYDGSWQVDVPEAPYSVDAA